jgi:hypothetical protein
MVLAQQPVRRMLFVLFVLFVLQAWYNQLLLVDPADR